MGSYTGSNHWGPITSRNLQTSAVRLVLEPTLWWLIHFLLNGIQSPQPHQALSWVAKGPTTSSSCKILAQVTRFLLFPSVQGPQSHSVDGTHVQRENFQNNNKMCYVPICSCWYSSCGRRKQVSTCSPVLSSMSVWNVSMGWAWFSDNQMAFRFKLVNENGKNWSLHETKGRNQSNLSATDEPGGSLPISRHVQNVKLQAMSQLRGQIIQLVFPQREDVQGGQVADFDRQFLQSIAVHIQIGQFGQVADGVGHLAQKILRQYQLLQGHASGTMERP